jgi:hypothetical protein
MVSTQAVGYRFYHLSSRCFFKPLDFFLQDYCCKGNVILFLILFLASRISFSSLNFVLLKFLGLALNLYPRHGQRNPSHFMKFHIVDNVYVSYYNDLMLYDVYIFLYKAFIIATSLLIRNMTTNWLINFRLKLC